MALRYRLSSNIKFNIKSYLEREFVNQGLYYNIASGTTWRTGERIDTLTRVNGNLYESYFDNWIYETDASGVSSTYATSVCSGIYVDHIFYAKDASPYQPVINYRKGQVILDGTAIPSTAVVSTDFSYKHVNVDFVDSDVANLLFSRYKDNVDYTDNVAPSGAQRQLPAVVIDLQRRIGMPFELGGSKQYSQLVVFHILANTSHELDQIADLLSERMYRKVIQGVDFNVTPELITYQGDVAGTYINYTDLQADTTNYFFQKLYIDEAEIIEMWNKHKMHYARVHWKVTIYKNAS